jgi:pyridoxal phosphate enzyme (YggS family)
MIHSVDSLKLAEAISSFASKIGKTQSILLEVNVSGEATKFGLESEKATDIIKNIIELPNIKLEGLMTMAPLVDNPEEVRPVFRGLRQLRDQLENEFPKIKLPHLSMGMTNDFEIAVEEGATLVRIGTALFQ